MIIKEKSVEYYFDSKKYDKEQIIENMKKEQLGFEKKNAKIDIILNEYGIYVTTLKFENYKKSIININIENAKEKVLIAKEKVLILKRKLDVIKDKISIKKDKLYEIKYIKNEIKDFQKEKERSNYDICNNKDKTYGKYKETKTYQPI